jgi:ParB family transcriptional regulator, chromosome partitioning protein
MTSGEFTRVPVDKIWVVRAERQRKELKGIKELADSIKRFGLIHPIVIDRDYRLWSGECRFAAVKMLSHDFVMCQWLDELDPATRSAIELEENIRRHNLTWQEEVCAVDKYHDLRRRAEEKEGKKWNHQDTADALGGMDQTTVSVYLDLAREIRAGNRKVIDAPNLSTARGWMERQTSRRDASIAAGAEKAVSEILGEEPAPSVLNTDFIKWAESYTGVDKFNFIHCDFPYGIDTDKRQQGNAVAIQGGYPDSFETYRQLVEALCKNLDRFCAESAHIMFWFSMRYYQWTLDYITDNTDFILDPFPLVWQKSDGKGLLPDPQRGPRRVYETCLFGSRGDRFIVGGKANACSKPTEDDPRHLSPKPQPVLRHFFEMFVDENTTILDPTCGSGNALCVAKEFGAARVLGLEIDPEFAEDAELLVAGTRRVIRRPATAAL